MIKKEITKEGIKLTHPSGVVQVISLESLKNWLKENQALLNLGNQYLTALQKEVLDVEAKKVI